MKGAVDFISGNMQKTERGFPVCSQFAPPCFGGMQKRAGPENVGADKRSGIDDRAIHMTFGSKVDYGVGLMGLEQIRDKFSVADISMYKNMGSWLVR